MFAKTDEIQYITQNNKNIIIIFIQADHQEERKEIIKANEQEVVEVVVKYRKGLLDEEGRVDAGSSSLKKDNVSPSQVVKIIDEQRKEEKEMRQYQRLPWPLKKLTMKDKINECLSPKLDELRDIFDENESRM
jgi:hypothetical protein